MEHLKFSNKKNRNCTLFPDHFVTENRTDKSQHDIAIGFNEFFVNIGPNLPKNIKPLKNKASIYDCEYGDIHVSSPH